MTIMKKALCLILAFCMLSIPVSFAEDTTTATAAEASDSAEITEFSDIDYSTPLGIAVNDLVEKSVISGFPDGTYKADQTLTRAEFAKIIVCFSNNYTETSQDSGFPDVDDIGGSAHWAKSYIKIARDMGIITGFPDGTFMPDAPVTYEQAVKMIMWSRLYTDLEYPNGYIRIASQKNLFKNSTHTGGQTAPITRGTTAIWIYNAFSIPENKKPTSSTTPGGGGGGGGGITIRPGGGGGGGGGGSASRDDSRKITGIVWGTETTMLDTTKSFLFSDELAIVYKNKEGETVREDLPVASKYLKKINDYLGMQIRATVKEDDDGKEYISDILIIEKQNREEEVDIEDFISYAISDETGEPTITYYNSDEKKDSLVLSNPENVYIIFNGKSISSEAAEDYEFNPSLITDTKIGSFKFYSNDGDKKYDIIFIESWKTSVINGKLSSLGTIKLKYGEDDINLLYSDPDNKIDRTVSTMISSSLHDPIEITSLKEYDVIDYKESLDKDFFTAEITSEKTAVTGSFIKFTDDGKIQIRNNSTDKKVEYKLNYNYIDYLENYSGSDKFIPEEYDTIKLYFNADKKVAAVEEIISTSDSKYGYITTLAYKNADASGKYDEYIGAEETPEEGDNVAMMLYQVDPSKSTIGTHTTTPLLVDSTVRVDGVIYKNKPEEVMTRLLTAAELINEGKNAPNNKNTEHSSLIRYEINGGKITVIDTVLDETGSILSTESDERFNTLFRSPSLVYSDDGENGGKHRYYSSSSTPGFYKKSESYSNRVKFYNNSSKSTAIFIPRNRSDLDYYSASKFKYDNFIQNMDYYVEAYNVSSGYGEFLLQYISDGKDVITSFSTMAIVTETDDESDSDALIIKYRTHSSNSVYSIAMASGSPAAQKYSSLNVGDVILFSTTLDKNMYDFFYALDITNLPDKRVDDEELLTCTADVSDRRIKGFDIYPDDKQNTENNAEYRTIYGTAQSFDSLGYSIVVNPMLYTDYFEEINEGLNEEHNLSSSTKLFVYDESEEKVVPYDTQAKAKNYLEEYLITSKQYGYADADKLFIYSSNSITTTVSSGDPAVRFVYLIRTKAQANPENYEGVETPIEDPLAEAKQSAKDELTEYINSIDKNDYLAHGNLFATILSNGKAAINEATDEDEILSAVVAAKSKADNVPSDSYIETAKETVSNYVDTNTYTEANTIVDAALTAIENADEKDEIDVIVSEALSEIDEAVLSDVASDKETELYEFVASFEYDFTEDTELTELIEGYKTALAEATSVAELNELYTEATAAIEEFVNSNYPKEDESDEEQGGDPDQEQGGDPDEEQGGDSDQEQDDDSVTE